jgi:hypothetical protein
LCLIPFLIYLISFLICLISWPGRGPGSGQEIKQIRTVIKEPGNPANQEGDQGARKSSKSGRESSKPGRGSRSQGIKQIRKEIKHIRKRIKEPGNQITLCLRNGVVQVTNAETVGGQAGRRGSVRSAVGEERQRRMKGHAEGAEWACPFIHARIYPPLLPFCQSYLTYAPIVAAWLPLQLSLPPHDASPVWTLTLCLRGEGSTKVGSKRERRSGEEGKVGEGAKLRR